MLVTNTTSPLWKSCAEIAWDAYSAGELSIAEEQYSLSLMLAREYRGPVHEDVGEALINLADFYMSTERYSEAEKTYRSALEVYNNLFGKENLVGAMIYRVIAELCRVQHRDREAEIFLTRAGSIWTGRRAS